MAKDMECPQCGKIHNRGEDKSIPRKDRTSRRSPVCEECYLRYRYAVNLLYLTRHRAKKRGISFDLDFDWIHQRLYFCAKTGIEFNIGYNGSNYSNRDPRTPSIDKINPELGYTKDNCQIVCWWYNVSKQRFTDEEVLELCRKVVDFYDTNHVETAVVPTH